MENNLYPLKLKTQFKDKIWGGEKIKTFLNKDFTPLPNCGETWEVSGVEGSESVVCNGFLQGNDLNELVEVYMGDLVGEKVYEKFGTEFPLLIKFIDANDDLSIQVHPNDSLAKKRHNSNGKTEMWYVIQADEGAELISGFNQEMNKEKYLESLNSGKINEVLNYEQVKAGDVFYIPSGRVHAICRGILLAEIQQTSDVTYRIYDWDRKDAEGNSRELHTELALEAIDFELCKDYKTNYETKKNDASEILKTQYFNTNIIEFEKDVEREFPGLDSFVLYICVEGEVELEYRYGKEKLSMGETMLVPAIYDRLFLHPSIKSKLLEVYID